MGTEFKIRRAVAACAVAASLCAAPAQAAVIDYVFEGYVTDGFDLTGVFGDLGSLTGHAITVRTSFDTSINRLTLPFYADAVGSTEQVSPLVSASITVGGTFTLPSPSPAVAGDTIYSDFNVGDYNSLQSFVTLSSGAVADALAANLTLRLDSGLLPTSLDTPFDLTSAASAGRFDGHFFVGRYSWEYGSDLGAGGDFAITRAYAAAAPAPIPEPAGWALMILGFGAAGTALRRRARAA